MHPKEYLVFKKTKLKRLNLDRKAIFKAFISALEYPLPASLRPATPDDIKKDTILWYHKSDPDPEDFYIVTDSMFLEMIPTPNKDFWTVVETILDQKSEYQAYLFNGQKYGLKGAFVEIEETKS